MSSTAAKTAANAAHACASALAALHHLPFPLTDHASSAELFAIQELLTLLNTTAKALQRRADASLRRTRHV